MSTTAKHRLARTDGRESELVRLPATRPAEDTAL